MQGIKDQLKKVIQDLYGLDFEPDVTLAPANIDADYSTNAPLKLAKELHKPPMEIAQELCREFARVTDLEGAPRPQLCEDGGGKSGRTRANVTPPGFLNFILSDEYLSNKITELAQDFASNISSDAYKGKTVICEFSDPNPFKVLHVGHLYTSIVGDSISRLFEYAGAKVIRANFGGDVGLHVAKTMYILQRKDPTTLTIEDIAKCYVEGTAAYEDDEHAHAEITRLNKEIYQINAEGIKHGRVTDLGGASHRRVTSPKEALHGRVTDLEGASRESLSGGGKPDRTRPVNDLADLYWQGRELSYDYFKAFYASIGLKFDKFYPESTVATLGLQKVKEQLEKGVYEKSNGAVIFDGEKYGLHTRVFINKEGVPTYETKDVGLIFRKWDDYHFDKSVVITGSEQLEYMRVVLKSVEQYAPDLVAKTTHLTHGLVKLPGNVKMSSRKGNFLKAVDVLDMVKDALKAEHGSTDDIISLAAAKYAFLKYKMGGNIIFDPKESVKMTGNSGPYLLYACVRAKKILASTVLRSEDGGEKSGGTRAERNLVKKTLEYKDILTEAVTEMAPHKVANYLYELAQEFSRFYEHCPVAGSDREAERVKIVKVYLDTMTHGLNILGITIPEEM